MLYSSQKGKAMEHINDCLVVFVKALHIPFAAGIYLNVRQKDRIYFETDNLGDNFPYFSIYSCGLGRKKNKGAPLEN